MKWKIAITVVLASLVCVCESAWCQKSPAQKTVKVATVAAAVRHHALMKHALARLIVKGPYTGLKGIEYSVLFTTESVVDVARIGLTAADKVFDVLSLQGKIPVLDEVYAVVSVGAKDSTWADDHIERLEQGIFGTHN